MKGLLMLLITAKELLRMGAVLLAAVFLPPKIIAAPLNHSSSTCSSLLLAEPSPCQVFPSRIASATATGMILSRP